MKFGVSPSPFVWWKRIEEFDTWISEVESRGFDSVFIPDHHDLQMPWLPSNELVDAWTTLAYITARSKTLKVGTCVTPLPRYLPSQLAKIIATVDNLSSGRTMPGLGVGYYANEFINYSPQGYLDEPKERVDRFVEGLEIMLKLWTEEKLTFNGKFYRLKDACLMPKPVQKPHPPLWSGGFGSRMLKITAKYFNAWLPHRGEISTPTPEKYEKDVNTIKEYMKKYGRNSDEFTFGLLGWTPINAEEDIKIIDKYVQAGCRYYIVEIPLMPPLSSSKNIEAITKFANEIIPSFQKG